MRTTNRIVCKGHFPLGGIFRAERRFLLFKDQLEESGRQKTKESIIPRGKFRLVENGPYGLNVKAFALSDRGDSLLHSTEQF